MVEVTQRKVKANFKHCASTDRESFKDTICLLPISVGRPYHEGEKFSATIELVNRSFKACTILVGDTLQRHTIALRQCTKAEETYYEALSLGDAWLARNQLHYKKLLIPYTIKRWDDFFDTSLYHRDRKIINDLYHVDLEFRTAVDTTVKAFLQRQEGQSDGCQYSKRERLVCSIDYVLEECAVLKTLGLHQYGCLLYPSQPPIFQIIKQKLMNDDAACLVLAGLSFKYRASPSSNADDRLVFL